MVKVIDNKFVEIKYYMHRCDSCNNDLALKSNEFTSIYLGYINKFCKAILCPVCGVKSYKNSFDEIDKETYEKY